MKTRKQTKQTQPGPLAIPANLATVRLTLQKYDAKEKQYETLEKRRLRISPERLPELSERLEAFIVSLSQP